MNDLKKYALYLQTKERHKKEKTIKNGDVKPKEKKEFVYETQKEELIIPVISSNYKINKNKTTDE